MAEMKYTEKPTALVVDDTPENLTLMTGILKDLYKVKIANSGERCLTVALSGAPPDIILLDIMMPGMDGYETCRQLKANQTTQDIPVIFLTAKAEVEDEMHGFELGAVDYITKPISPPITLARVQTHLQLKLIRDYLKNQNVLLEQEVERRTREIATTQEVTILTMASLAETRDNETGNHIRRTQFFLRILAEKLRFHPNFRHSLDNDQTVDMLFKSAPLHDIGKIGIPDHILLKPGRFTPEEFEIMKTHSALGRDSILAAERRLGAELPFLSLAKEIAYSHHEKWDGSGYPEGLSGDGIPVSGRLMAVADVYDALISRRIYKEPMPHDKAVKIILEGKGTHFDPDMVDAFEALSNEFADIAKRYEDSVEDVTKTIQGRVPSE
ncbi:MAG: two-component system response regulator [Syntrophaceae bacterium]|nr:two-component system response regulator [Syntrophaceae bacterium]